MDEAIINMIKKSFEKVKRDISENADLINQLTFENKALKKEIEMLHQSAKKNVPKTALQQEMFRKVNKHSRAIIKQKIIDICSIKQLTLAEIKEIIVDQGKYCSKASYYRYIDEMIKRGQINIVEINGTSIVSIPSLVMRQK